VKGSTYRVIGVTRNKVEFSEDALSLNVVKTAMTKDAPEPRPPAPLGQQITLRDRGCEIGVLVDEVHLDSG
jgi:hypothetical protein